MDDFNMDPDLTIESITIRSILSNKDLLAHPMKATCTDKGKDYNDIYADASAAFLGPNIWDKNLSEFKMDYLDLDALLNGSDDGHQKVVDCNELDANEKVHHHLHHHHHHHHQQQQQHHQQQQQPHHHHHPQHHHHRHNLPAEDVPAVLSSRQISCQSSDEDDSSDISKDRETQMYSVDCKFSPTDLALATPPGQEHYDPSSSIIPEEELKPQPIIKKSRKNFVPDNLKDDKYWARRHKNNIAAKRSREARRLKENQIVLRASYLEKENNSLKEDVMRLKAENDMLKNQLKEYQS